MPSLTSSRKRRSPWQIYDTPSTHPGPCEHASWCDGICEDLEPDSYGTEHGRDVAAALVDGVSVVEICVGQWKANPKHGIRDTGSCWALNRDRPPVVGIFTYGGERQGTFLKVPWGRTIVEALHLVGHDLFADALDIARCLAEEIEGERRAAEEERKTRGRVAGVHPDYSRAVPR